MPKQLAETPSEPILAPSASNDEQELVTARAKIIENLGFSPVAVDELVRQCQLSPSLVLTVLLELELAGRLDRQPGQRVALIA